MSKMAELTLAENTATIDISISLARSEVLYTDDDFTPTHTSVAMDTDENWGDVVCLRAVNGYAGLNPILYSTPSPYDIKQGSVGNCCFLSSLSSLARWPRVIERLFAGPVSVQDMLTTCKLCVNLCIAGVWKAITIDDYLPCSVTHGSTPIFGSCMHPTMMWVGMAEKAWAKVFGSFAKYACLYLHMYDQYTYVLIASASSTVSLLLLVSLTRRPTRSALSTTTTRRLVSKHIILYSMLLTYLD